VSVGTGHDGFFLSSANSRWHGTETEVDRAWGKLAGFKMRAIAHDDDAIEGETWLGTVPIDKLVNRVAIAALRFFRTETVQDGRPRMFQIGQAQDGLGGGVFLLTLGFLHDWWPPAT